MAAFDWQREQTREGGGGNGEFFFSSISSFFSSISISLFYIIRKPQSEFFIN